MSQQPPLYDALFPGVDGPPAEDERSTSDDVEDDGFVEVNEEDDEPREERRIYADVPAKVSCWDIVWWVVVCNLLFVVGILAIFKASTSGSYVLIDANKFNNLRQELDECKYGRKIDAQILNDKSAQLYRYREEVAQSEPLNRALKSELDRVKAELERTKSDCSYAIQTRDEAIEYHASIAGQCLTTHDLRCFDTPLGVH